MTLPDMLFLILVVALPIFVSVRLFLQESDKRPFLAAYALAVVGSSVLFVIVAFALMVFGIGGLGPFDGIFEFIVSLPVALISGLLVRRHRNHVAL